MLSSRWRDARERRTRSRRSPGKSKHAWRKNELRRPLRGNRKRAVSADERTDEGQKGVAHRRLGGIARPPSVAGRGLAPVDDTKRGQRQRKRERQCRDGIQRPLRLVRARPRHQRVRKLEVTQAKRRP